MTEDAHVYCTECKHFNYKIINDDGDFKPFCIHEDKCNIWDCEDSKPYKDRPRYEVDDMLKELSN
jgi:hypothetical protein